jgi:hypothetical protein
MEMTNVKAYIPQGKYASSATDKINISAEKMIKKRQQ